MTAEICVCAVADHPTADHSLNENVSMERDRNLDQPNLGRTFLAHDSRRTIGNFQGCALIHKVQYSTDAGSWRIGKLVTLWYVFLKAACAAWLICLLHPDVCL